MRRLSDICSGLYNTVCNLISIETLALISRNMIEGSGAYQTPTFRLHADRRGLDHELCRFRLA
jgi:hypothetical protein